jgi:RES domain-containing protein
MVVYRIADARHGIFDATGAMLRGGRWNSIGQRVIYASGSYAGAMLEVLVHANLASPPKNHRVVRITIPERVRVERLGPSELPGWDAEDFVVSRGYGDAWLKEMRSAVLLVPSVITEGRESNVVMNPPHPEFSMISVGEPEAIRWDLRLFGGGGVGR